MRFWYLSHVSSKGSDEPAHMGSLTRAFTASIHKVRTQMHVQEKFLTSRSLLMLILRFTFCMLDKYQNACIYHAVLLIYLTREKYSINANLSFVNPEKCTCPLYVRLLPND